MPNGRLASVVLAMVLVIGLAAGAERAGGVPTDAISIPQLINYQGKLTDGGGTPREGLFDMVFRMYDVQSGGTPIWQESQNDVPVTGGLFNVILGSTTPITSIPDGPQCWFEVSVEGQLISPRVRMVSAPYAYNSDDAANLGGIPAANHITNTTPAVGDLTGTYPGPTIASKGATSGQVLKWSGSAWLPGNDLQGGSGGVTSVSQAAGVVCTPNPITSTGTVGFDQTWGDARYIRNQSASAQTPGSFWISGGGRGQQFYGVSATSNVPAVWGAGGTYDCGVLAQSSRSDAGAAEAVHANASGTGVIGVGNNTTGSYLTSGSGGAFTGSAIGDYAKANNATGTGMLGVGNALPSGTYLTDGSGGAFTGAENGCFDYATNVATGTGTVGAGNNGSIYTLDVGSGGAFTGTQYGAVGFATNTSGNRAGGYFATTDLSSPAYAYVGLRVGTTLYKINGAGTVSTVMATREGRKNLFCSEMPESWFEDVGEGQLVNGHCRIELEPLFTDCITVNARQPMKVFVQLEGDCNGVYVTKDATGFDVHELQGGTSNARFSYRVMAKWKGNENLRFPDAPPPLEIRKTVAATQQAVEIKTADPARHTWPTEQ